MESIGWGAFEYCSNLTEITSLNPEPPTCSSYVFYEVDTGNCTLYVPKGSKEAYASANVWKDFLNIVEIGSTTDDDEQGDGSEVDENNEDDNSDVNGDEQGDNSDVNGDEQGDGSETNGISGVAADGQANVSGYYTIDGKEVGTLQKGVNIVKYTDGTTRKVLVK